MRVLTQPAQALGVLAFGQHDLVGQRWQHTVQRVVDLGRQTRALDEQAHFGIERSRARVKVQRTDKQPQAVNRKSLGMQTGAGAAFYLQAMFFGRLALRGLLFEFIQGHASFKQVLAALGVAGMHRRHVGGLQRVGQYTNAHALLAQCHQRFHAIGRRHEIGRHQIHRLGGRLQHLLEPGQQQVFLLCFGQHLGRVVAHQLRGRPFKGQRALDHAAHESGLAQRLDISLCRRVALCFSRVLAHLLHLLV